MCVVSAVSDDWTKRFPETYPNVATWIPHLPIDSPSYAEFATLKSDFEKLLELLKAAKIYDEATNQKDCEMEEKVALLKKIAELVGVDISEVF